MRLLLAAVLVLGLAGCMDFDLPDLSGRENVFPDTLAKPRDPSCHAVATDRASDVAQQGFDDEVQRAVYEQTYADCLAWAARGARAITQ